MTNRTLIIAEAGVNHNGDLGLAKRLIDAASEAGADLVKFQIFSADRLATRTAKKADYQTQATDCKESQHEMRSLGTVWNATLDFFPLALTLRALTC